MKFLRRVLICAFLMLVSVSFFACDIGEAKTISGAVNVVFDDEWMGDVEINTSTSNLGKTDEFGNFSFAVNSKSVTIIPKKEGYYFIPKSITINDDNDNLNFEAVKIENLEGSLKLKSICIIPTSIASMGDNYSFNRNGKEAIKLNSLTLRNEDTSYDVLNGACYLFKNEKNYIEFNDYLVYNCNDKISLSFLLKANFTSMSREWVSANTAYTYLNVTSAPKNSELNNGTIKYSLYGLNSETKAFTYDISFVFEYVE